MSFQMLILTDYNHDYNIRSVDEPLSPQYYWHLSGVMQDLALSAILYLEETTGQTVLVDIAGYPIYLPASWNILIVDDQTKSIDTISIINSASKTFEAMIFSSLTSVYHKAPIRVIDLLPEHSCVHPMINKNCMMLHPVGHNPSNANDIFSIAVGPFDLYPLLEDISAKDLIYY